MKFTAINGIWTLAVILLTFQIMLYVYDDSIVFSIIYSFVCFLNGSLFGIVFADWAYNK